METQKQSLVRSVLDSWYARVDTANKAFDSFTDEQLQREIAPNKNRVLYVLGHLTAVHDRMLPLLNLEPQVNPHLDAVFLEAPDRYVAEIPTAQELRANWKSINGKLADHFSKLSPDEWFQKHNSVSAEEFAKEPHRNRLNIVIGRTNHISHHLGQLSLLKK